MSEHIVITTLVENTVNIGGLCGEHGLAFLVRAGGRKLLFDTGQSGMLVPNATKMGLSLEDLEVVVLSHGHYDHTGGLEAVLATTPQARVFLHPKAVDPKFTQNADGTSRAIGMPPRSTKALSKMDSRVVWTSGPTEVLPGLFLTGEIPRRTTFEDTGGRFFLDAACARPDPLLDDQALFFETSRGVVVLLGCAHAGVVNTLEHVTDLTHGKPLWAVMGGMHLLKASAERLDRTIEALRRWNIGKFVPAHCTGMDAAAKLWGTFPKKCSLCPVGTSMEFGAW